MEAATLGKGKRVRKQVRREGEGGRGERERGRGERGKRERKEGELWSGTEEGMDKIVGIVEIFAVWAFFPRLCCI